MKSFDFIIFFLFFKKNPDNLTTLLLDPATNF